MQALGRTCQDQEWLCLLDSGLVLLLLLEGAVGPADSTFEVFLSIDALDLGVMEWAEETGLLGPQAAACREQRVSRVTGQQLSQRPSRHPLAQAAAGLSAVRQVAEGRVAGSLGPQEGGSSGGNLELAVGPGRSRPEGTNRPGCSGIGNQNDGGQGDKGTQKPECS